MQQTLNKDNQNNNVLYNFSIWSLLKVFKKQLLIVLVLYILNESGMIFGPYTFSKILSSFEGFYNKKNTIHALYACIIGVTCFWTFFITIGAIVKINGGILFNKIENYIKKNVFNFLHYISYEDFLLITSEKAFNYLKILEYCTKEIFGIVIVDMFANSFTIVINIIILMFVLPELGILTLVWTILHFILLRFSFANILKTNKNLLTTKSNMVNNILETFLNILMIKTTNSQEYEKEKLGFFSQQYMKAYKKFLIHTEIISMLTLIVCEIALWGGGMCVVVYKIHTIQMPISKLTYIFMIIYNIASKVKNIGIKICKLFEHLGEYNIVYNLLQNYKIPITTQQNLLEELPLEKKPIIELNQVSLFHKDVQILKNINLKLYPGEKVCFIGPSGCGKTTIANLLCGLYTNYQGAILINNHDIKHLDTNSIIDCVSIANQNSILFTRSVRDNLIQDKNVSDEILHHYCKIAQIHDFIMSLPQGYDTIINIKTISGGQGQRICLARTLIRNTQITIFDEATNGLDSLTKHAFLKKIFENSYRLEKKQQSLETLIFIQHELDFLPYMDRIVLFHNGEIAIDDSYENMKHMPLFKQIKQLID